MVFHNVNGFKDRESGVFQELIFEQRTMTIDVQCISEHQRDTQQFRILNDLHEQLQKEKPGQTVLQIDSSKSAAAHSYKPGGTAIIAMGDIIGRLEPKGRGGDSMGRWSYVTFRRKGTAPLTIISAYQVCRAPTNAIGNTAWHQQRLALNGQGRHQVHPRKAFIDDMIQFIATLQRKNHAIIVGGDFNETLEDTNSGLLRLATATQLVDPWNWKHTNYPTFHTQITGSKRIDSVLVSPNVLTCLLAIGYAPYGYISNSDHRPMFIEFDTKKLFGDDVDRMTPPQFRGVRTNDRKAVTTYVETLYKHLSSNNALNLQTQLDDVTVTPETIERADNLLGRGSDAAEKACKRRRPEYYSQPLVQQRMIVRALAAYRADLKYRQQTRIKTLSARLRRAQIDIEFPPDLETTTQRLNDAKLLLRQFQKDHGKLRKSEQDHQLQTEQSTRKEGEINAIRRIQASEANRQTFKILQNIRRKRGDTPSLDRLEIPSSWPRPGTEIQDVAKLEDPQKCNEWTTVTDPNDIEYYILLRNRVHFGQAQGTPFTVPPLAQAIDWSASTPDADAILQGTNTMTSLSPQSQALLEACIATTTNDAGSSSLTLQEFMGKIRAWRETTTTSPSGRHLGRYKALHAKSIYDPHIETEQYHDFQYKQTIIAKFHLSIINACLRIRHTLARWKTIVNVMILKDPGVYRIHRLRIIHLYEADFNLVLTVIWRKALHTADNTNSIHSGQLGGRPGCDAPTIPFVEELKYDISYMTRRTLYNFDNDAKSCYDRIIPSLASLVNRKYGIHQQVVQVHADTLYHARYKLKIANKVSDMEYSHCPQFPIYGTGQGSGNSPSIWLFISATLFEAHERQAHGATFMSADGSVRERLTMMGFVDDTTGTCNDFRPQHQIPTSELGKLMEHDAQVWTDLLYTSGGCLELLKTSYQVLQFQFHSSGTPRPITASTDNPITLRDPQDGSEIVISELATTEAHKTLGHFKSPADPRQSKQLHALQSKAQQLSILISTSPITRKGAEFAYNSIYIPAIRYPLPQSFFTQQTLNKLEAKFIGPIIAKCGYNRHAPSAVMYGPKEYGGAGFVRWYTLQGEGQIMNFVKHWRTDSKASNLLRIALSWAQWQAGTKQSILKDTVTPLPHLECRWIKSLRQFLQHSRSQILVDTPFIPQAEREGDFHIMEAAIRSKKFTAQEICTLNYCRYTST